MYSFRQIEKFLGKEVEKRPLPDQLGEGPAYEPKHRTARASRYCHRGRGGKNHRRNRGNK